MQDETIQSLAQKKFKDVMKVDSPQKGTPDEYMDQWLQALKDAGVARLEWKSYFSDDQVYFDDYDLYDAEDDYISEFPHTIVNGNGLDSYLENLQGMLYAMDTSGHYILDVASGAVTRIEDIFENTERVEEPVEHVQYTYNVETKTWLGPVYPEDSDDHAPYYVQIKLDPTEKLDYRNRIIVADPPIGEIDRWETIDGTQRHMVGAIKDALELRNDGNNDDPRHKFSARVVDRLGNIVFIASLMGVDWDSRAPFSVRWVNKEDQTNLNVTLADISTYDKANTELVRVQALLKDTNTNSWIAQMLDNKGEVIKTLYSEDTHSTTFTGIRASAKRMYEVQVAEGKEFLSKGKLAEVEPNDLYSFADHVKSLADWQSTVKFGVKSFGEKAVEFEVDAHAESDDQGGSYWSIDDFVARDKDGVTLSRLSSLETMTKMIESGEVAKLVAQRNDNQKMWQERFDADPKGHNNAYMAEYYKTPLFEGEISLDNIYFVEWAEQYIDDQWNDDLGGSVSFNPDMYVYRVDQPPLYNGKFNNARYFVWTPEMTDEESRLQKDYAVAYIRKLSNEPEDDSEDSESDEQEDD